MAGPAGSSRFDTRHTPECSIDDYALIGDCRSAALVSRGGSIDWLCWPRFDSPSLFGALLDPRAGCWSIGPTEKFRARRSYVEDTNVLVTRFETAAGSIAVTDLMPVAGEDEKRSLLLPEHEILGTFAVGTNPNGVAFDGANIWVANYLDNNVTKLRTSDGAALGTFAVGTKPTGVAFDGANIWVANGGSNNVTKLRASDGVLLGTFAVGTGPGVVVFDGDNIWVANLASNNVTKLRASDGMVIGTFAVGTSPQGIAFDGANVWVANGGSNTVTKL